MSNRQLYAFTVSPSLSSQYPPQSHSGKIRQLSSTFIGDNLDTERQQALEL